ncbi:hypothetical protein SAY86_024587 [Trapa natans]|uniref:BHLH domain-containing protein n=1 Tax=Trapa natans TaxID=22666 RepID=A0AAN7MHM0_TRANT|nr:hypothetical protein SAY86_024587 [Trapa natans]
MNHYVPDFEKDDDYSMPTLGRSKKSNMAGNEIMELMWQNGPVVMHSQRSVKKPSASGFAELIPMDRRDAQDQNGHHNQHPQQQSLFMQEDEMASWLLNDNSYDFCPDLLYSTAAPAVIAAAASNSTTTAPSTTVAACATVPVGTPASGGITTYSAVRALQVAAQRPLLLAPRPPMLPLKKVENFGHLSRLSRLRKEESGPSLSNQAVNDSTVVDSSDTPAAPPQSRVSEAFPWETSRRTIVGGSTAAPALALATSSLAGVDAGETAVCEVTATTSLSPGGSSASAEPPAQKPPSLPTSEDRKRKGRDCDDGDCQSEDVDLEYADGKKEARGSISTKRSRAAEVHNMSERRRRDRINEKMRALQELIPHCNKADKASMLDEAIEYLKSLQLQVQMMSMGCGMVPMMFPGVPMYVPNMGMGIGMGMGMNRPVMPFPNILAGSPFSAPGSRAHMNARFPMPPFHMQHVDPTRSGVPTSHQPPDPMMNSLMMQNSSQPRIPSFVDPYQQYISLQNLQLQTQQNQNQSTEQGTSKTDGKEDENLESSK